MVIKTGRAAVADTTMLGSLNDKCVTNVTVEVEILRVKLALLFMLSFDSRVLGVRIGDLDCKAANKRSKNGVANRQKPNPDVPPLAHSFVFKIHFISIGN